MQPILISFIEKQKIAIFILWQMREKKVENVEIGFRVSGKQPELWNAETGKMKDVVVWNSNPNGTVSMPINLDSEEAVFIIFTKPVDTSTQLVNASWKVEKPKAEPLSNLKIIKAEYGTFLQEGLIDITQLVKNEVKGNEVDFSASRHVLRL